MTAEEIAGECTICGADMYDQEETYGLTSGIMSNELGGFCSSDSVPWEEVLCLECMDEIDRALLSIKERLQQERIKHGLNTHIRSSDS